MDPGLIATEIQARLDRVPGLTGRTFPYPPPSPVAPAGIVSYPDTIAYDQTYGRGSDRIQEWPVLIVVGKATDRTAAERIYAYADPGDPASVKRALEVAGPAPWDDLRVASCTFDVVTIAGVDYISALFICDISGQGTR